MRGIVEKVILLQNVGIFSKVSTQQLAHLAAIAEEMSLPGGGTIYKEQDPADAMYLVLEGEVQLHRDGKEVEVAKAEDAFGTWALFDDEPRVATATALKDVQLLRIDREDFIDLLSDHVQIAEGVLKVLARRLRGLLGRINVGSGEERVS